MRIPFMASLLAALALSTAVSMAQPSETELRDRMACTSIMVGRLASTDGSVITSHTCDSWYRTWMSVVPAADHKKGETTAIRDGLMYTQHVGDSTGVHIRGRIPQVAHTYQFLNTAYPCLNEKQLAMGETTIGGRDTLKSAKGLFYIEELQRVALERCTTAREAIRLMGQLIKDYGYCDSGECLTIADPREVWIFEVFGEGPKNCGGVWAAVRIPDDHIAVSANVSRITTLNLADTDHYMASDNVFDVARRLKLWDGKSEFSFFKAYSNKNYTQKPKNYDIREHFIMSHFAPSAQLSDTVTTLPLSIKPDKPLSAQDVMNMFCSYYEGTPLHPGGTFRVPNKGRYAKPEVKADSILSSRSNPWMRPDEIEMYHAMGHTEVPNLRTISVSWCAYSTVIQLRSWLPDAIGGVAWVGLDNPGESPRFPIFSGTTKLPTLLSICGQHSDRDDAALWHYRKTNRLATVRWGNARASIEKAREYYLEKGRRELPFVESQWLQLQAASPEHAQEMLNGYTADFFGATITRWDEMGRALWRSLWTGF